MKCNDKSWGADQLLSLLIYIFGSALVYYTIFNNQYLLKVILEGKGYGGAAYTLIVIILAATLYGSAVSIFVKCTLEKALEDRAIRKG